MCVKFDLQKLEAFLDAEREFAFLPFSVHFFECVGSTNQVLWNLLEQGAKSGTVVIATEQTSGRGQWGREWISPVGGLYLSVAFAPMLEANSGYQLTLATAWGIAKQLQAKGIPVEIKWPNDLVLTNRKLGGILTETKVHQGLISQAVIGVGINWANPVPDTGINLKMWQLNQHFQLISCMEILASTVLTGIESGIQCLFKEGTNILLSRYLELLKNKGEKVYVNDLTGTVVGVTHNGELCVRMETSESESSKTQEIYFQPGTISLGY
jgi:BirA family biotin operon repressor/biotin-[acetyl-CoA-carboxylase] ligase